MYLSAEHWPCAVWELKKWSVREREHFYQRDSAYPTFTNIKLIDNELWLPGKTGRLVTQSLTLRVLRPFFQIASSRIAYPSTAAAILRLDIQTPLIQWQRRTVTHILKDVVTSCFRVVLLTKTLHKFHHSFYHQILVLARQRLVLVTEKRFVDEYFSSSSSSTKLTLLWMCVSHLNNLVFVCFQRVNLI